MQALQLSVVIGLVLVMPLGAVAQTCVEPPAGLVSWWPAEGTAEDIAGDNEGSLVGGASFGAGEVGSGFSLDGFDDRIVVADDPSLELQTITIEGWVRTTASGDRFVASYSGTTGLFGYEAEITPSGVFRFLLNGGAGGADVFGVTDLRDGQYHHVAATFDGTQLAVYIDGELDARVVAPSVIEYETGAGLVIGARDYAPIPGHWSGEIDELSIYSRGLCSTEIQAIFDAGSAGKCSGGIAVDCTIFTDDFESGGVANWSNSVP